MKIDDRVWHRTHKVWATVKSTPRAHATAIRLQLDGNLSASYYNIADLTDGPDGTPVPDSSAAKLPAPSIDDHADKPDNLGNIVARAHGVAAAKTNNYEGDLTVDRLREMRRKIRDGLELLDEKIVSIVAFDAVRKALATVRFQTETSGRAETAGDALKIKRDTDQALAAANRLHDAVQARVNSKAPPL